MTLTYGIQEEYHNFIGITTQKTDAGVYRKVTSEPVVLTGDFTENSEFKNVAGCTETTLYVEYTPGQNSGVFELQLETSGDSGNDNEVPTFYQDVSTAIASGVATVNQSIFRFTGSTSGTTYRFRVLFPVADKLMRVSVRDTATTKGSATIRLFRSGRS